MLVDDTSKFIQVRVQEQERNLMLSNYLVFQQQDWQWQCRITLLIKIMSLTILTWPRHTSALMDSWPSPRWERSTTLDLHIYMRLCWWFRQWFRRCFRHGRSWCIRRNIIYILLCVLSNTKTLVVSSTKALHLMTWHTFSQSTHPQCIPFSPLIVQS